MKRIKLTCGMHAIVNDADYKFLKGFHWHIHKSRSSLNVYARCTVDGKKILMHRMILLITDPTIHIDHRNRNGLDNRRRNLRPSDVSQNLFNCRKRRGAYTSRFKGVSRCSYNSKKWVAHIGYRRTQKNLGVFDTEEAAAQAYASAAKKLFGEFANAV